MRIAHISDLHIGNTIKGALDAFTDEVSSIKPDIIIVSGDITQRAHVGQFEKARRFFERLSVPIFAVAGNHDIPLWHIYKRFVNPFENFQSQLRIPLEFTWENEFVRL